jgi:exonuclease-1
MGIYRLFSFLKQYLKPINIKEYEYQTCGIDGHYFLHKLLPKLGLKILEEVPDLTPIYKILTNNFIQLRKEYKIEPIIILEGDDTPIRRKIKSNRIDEREIKLKKVEDLIKENKYSEAKKYKIEAMSIRPYHCKEFYDLCQLNNIKCMVCPYEVDQQLKYLEKNKKIDFIIGSDSDLIALSCKNVIFQFNFDTLEGLRYNQDECKLIFFENNFNEERLLIQCILRGCYFYNGINQDNFDITLKILNEESGNDYKKIIKKLLEKNNNLETFNEQIIEFEKAYISFRYGIIYDLDEQKEKYLNDLPSDKSNFVYKYNLDDIVGVFLDKNIIDGIINGKISSKTLEEIKDIPKPTHDFINKINNNKNQNMRLNKENDNQEKYKENKNPFFNKDKKTNKFNKDDKKSDNYENSNDSEEEKIVFNKNKYSTHKNNHHNSKFNNNDKKYENFNKTNYYHQNKTNYYDNNYNNEKNRRVYHNNDNNNKNKSYYNRNENNYFYSDTFNDTNNKYNKKKYFNYHKKKKDEFDINNYEMLYEKPVYFNSKYNSKNNY